MSNLKADTTQVRADSTLYTADGAGPYDIYIKVSAIINAGLMVEPSVEWVHSPSVFGTVISQIPPSGTVTSLNTQIALVASAGPADTQPTTTIPSIIGMQRNQASIAMFNARLLYANPTCQYDPSIAASYVISQSPAAGTVVAIGTMMSWVVSNGIAPTTTTVTVP